MQLVTVFFINRFSDTAEGPPPPTGVFAPNNDLQKARRLFEGELVGAEAFVADKDGKYYWPKQANSLSGTHT